MFDRKRCEECAYSSMLNEHDPCCVYILVENQMRGCYGEGDCDKFRPRTKQRRMRICKDGGFVYEYF